jgi:hypothetical protein
MNQPTSNRTLHGAISTIPATASSVRSILSTSPAPARLARSYRRFRFMVPS